MKTVDRTLSQSPINNAPRRTLPPPSPENNQTFSAVSFIPALFCVQGKLSAVVHAMLVLVWLKLEHELNTICSWHL